ncbi:MAG: cell envelope integrity protein CreD [Candidatus Omnitrophica bacterium]|nr:cell envelope integrity protein CreD [Candidatus Omnitrophota bacterium]
MTSDNKWKNSAGLKLIAIAVLIGLLLVPANAIKSLIREREHRQRDVIQEISDMWGGEQVITGLVLTVPFTKKVKDDKGVLTTITQNAYFLPEELSVKSELNPEIRYRGIYKVVVYAARLHLDGYFIKPDFESLSVPPEDVVWKDAGLVVGISSLRGVKEVIKIMWNDSELTAEPGVGGNEVVASGISVRPEIRASSAQFKFAMDIKLNGGKTVNFVPVGKKTVVKMSSSWNNPSFTGAFLPEKREVNESGFNAEWKILDFNRDYPQKWIGSTYQQQVISSAFGTELLVPVDEYQKSERTSKYASMFIVLTFLSFFIIELLNKKLLHPIQYLLIGIALVIFYTLLLAFSEHVSFNNAYLIASVSTILLIAGYTRSILLSKLLTFLIALILTVFYTFFFIILQLQDYSLLIGSIGLFVILAVFMYLTRKIDWYNLDRK